MSDEKEEMSGEQRGRVNVNDLSRREEELKDEEARQIKGGGGAMGGVDFKQGANNLETFGSKPGVSSGEV